MKAALAALLAAVVSSLPRIASAQAAVSLPALRALAPFSALPATAAGQAALAGNYRVTGAIEMGTLGQPALQPFAQQRDQALSDAFITSGDAAELADGLGTHLGTAYRAIATYTSGDDGATSSFTNVSPAVADLIATTEARTSADAAAAKFFFANATFVSRDDTSPLTNDAAAILTATGGVTDVYGRAYHRLAGSAGADPNGDSRPFQTETPFPAFTGLDYFGILSPNDAYLDGPVQNLTASPSFPSGHTCYGYTESLVLALLVPQRYPQMIVRAAEYGNSRIVIGAHYAMDVLGGRTIALYDVAHLLAQDPSYEIALQNAPIPLAGYRAALASARDDVTKAMMTTCATTLAECANDDGSRFADAAKDRAFYESTQTYGLPVVYPAAAQVREDVATLAPEAGYLLSAAYPSLTLAQADDLLTQTEGPGGGFLDNGSPLGVYSRLDLYRASLAAQALARAR